jgi:hypothetical protein
VKNFPDINYAKKMNGDVNPGYTTYNPHMEKKNKKLLTMAANTGGFG